jgi:hypothetical protein
MDISLTFRIEKCHPKLKGFPLPYSRFSQGLMSIRKVGSKRFKMSLDTDIDSFLQEWLNA